MQLALLDRIAGTAVEAAAFGGQLRRLRELEGQLAAIDALGDEDQRDAMQALVDEVKFLQVLRLREGSDGHGGSDSASLRNLTMQRILCSLEKGLEAA